MPSIALSANQAVQLPFPSFPAKDHTSMIIQPAHADTKVTKERKCHPNYPFLIHYHSKHPTEGYLFPFLRETIRQNPFLSGIYRWKFLQFPDQNYIKNVPQ